MRTSASRRETAADARTYPAPHTIPALHRNLSGHSVSRGQDFIMSASSSGTLAIRARRPVSSRYTCWYKRATGPPRPPHVVASLGRTWPPLAQLGSGSPRRHATTPRLGWRERDVGLQRARGLLPKLPASPDHRRAAQRGCSKYPTNHEPLAAVAVRGRATWNRGRQLARHCAPLPPSHHASEPTSPL